ncbi:hypothetical protein AUP68_17371 [Ilyonectria robusta]
MTEVGRIIDRGIALRESLLRSAYPLMDDIATELAQSDGVEIEIYRHRDRYTRGGHIQAFAEQTVPDCRVAWTTEASLTRHWLTFIPIAHES